MRKPSKQAAPAPADAFAIARELLLEGQGLELAALDRALSTAMVRKLDYVDLYLQLTRYETWTVEDGIVKEGAYSVDQGIGVRAISGERTGFAYSDQLDETALTDAVVAARGIARAKGGGSQKIPARVT
ncbi:MAG TPA: DNA gyrase modulator, partial [Gammaproteobacteria bacterium]|nr:DNA gyrase modulator [Gammaproteobacteria bacterium]